MANQDLISVLRRHQERVPTGALASELKVSRTTLSRLIAAAPEPVLTIGRGRRTCYAASRALRNGDRDLPVYRVNSSGTVDEFATLRLAYRSGAVLDLHADLEWPLTEDTRDRWFEGIPFIFYDLRPNGFIGRAFANTVASPLQLSPDPRDWSDDDVLFALSIYGADGSGNYIVGEPALKVWLDRVSNRAPPINDDDLSAAYDRLASHALQGGPPGSSAAGEFPKFTALRKHDGGLFHVIVKFSGADGSVQSLRWADLLVCEALASETIREALELDAAQSLIYRTTQRTYLEVARFDRAGSNGRHALCSWAAIKHDLIGEANNWNKGAERLEQAGLIDVHTRHAINRLWHFGRLIGNTDMHDGNLSFMPDGDKVRLAPSYDMLPMTYAPQRGVELAEREFRPALPVPAERDDWMIAADAAVLFWMRAAEDARISGPFRAICAENAASVRWLTALSQNPA
jgi:hypothetical protein